MRDDAAMTDAQYERRYRRRRIHRTIRTAVLDEVFPRRALRRYARVLASIPGMEGRVVLMHPTPWWSDRAFKHHLATGIASALIAAVVSALLH